MKMVEFDELELNYLYEALMQFNWDQPELDGDSRQYYLDMHKQLKQKISKALDSE
jgi:hypothetical protein